ncbi:MAG: thioredoxin [Candidatus Obscuribacterales bacterium]|nr:thioredoxin [Candidatus Obscuribacterales bacterium]
MGNQKGKFALLILAAFCLSHTFGLQAALSEEATTGGSSTPPAAPANAGSGSTAPAPATNTTTQESTQKTPESATSQTGTANQTAAAAPQPPVSTATAATPGSDAEFRAEFSKWDASYKKADYKTAEETLQNLLNHIEKNNPKYQKYLAETLSAYIKTEYVQHKTSETLPLYEKLAAQVKKQYGPNSVELAKTLRSYAMVCSRLGDATKAAQLEKQASIIMMNPTASATPGTRTAAAPEGGVTDLHDGEFASLVTASKRPVLVDFYTDWCGPCKFMAPFVEEIAKSYAGRLKVLRCNIDNNHELASRFNVEAIPTFIVFCNGKIAKRHTGGMKPEDLNALVVEGMSKMPAATPAAASTASTAAKTKTTSPAKPGAKPAAKPTAKKGIPPKK